MHEKSRVKSFLSLHNTSGGLISHLWFLEMNFLKQAQVII